jgi:hypothetical protein
MHASVKVDDPTLLDSCGAANSYAREAHKAVIYLALDAHQNSVTTQPFSSYTAALSFWCARISLVVLVN